MRITLKQLILKNFKGLKDFALKVEGDASVYGNNGVGKTTLKDAISWLLFDKDSQNKKDFSIKPQDEKGNAIHNLETEVEAILLCDGREVKLKKMFCEKWTKKRGQELQEFSGHETSYWCDDVPLKKGEYQVKIDSLINENLFKLITDPLFFNTQLKWDERRNKLFEFVGTSITDDDVIFSNPALKDLTTILNGKSIDDYKKIVSARLKALNEQIDKLPTRIDEVTKGMPEEVDSFEVEKELLEQKEALQSIEAKLMDFDSAAKEYISKQQKLSQLQGKLQQRGFDLKNIANKVANDAILKKNSLETAIQRFKTVIKNTVSENEKYGIEVEELTTKKAELEKQWYEEKAKKFVEPTGLLCPSCGQDLPSDMAGAKTDELREKFDKDKAAKISLINITGKNSAERITSLNKLIADNQKAMVDDQEQIDKYTEELNNLPNTDTVDVDLDSDKDYVDISNRIKELQTNLEKPISDTSELRSAKTDIELKITVLNRQLGSKDTITAAKARIEELRNEQKETAQQIANLEKSKFLLEQFSKAKCNLLEDSINGKFKLVRFKLFDTQINGAIVECCETLVNTNGSYVEYNSSNNAGRINAGLDIINVLSGFYGVSAPIFIDNAESVVELENVNSQVIRLVVSESDNKLRVMEGGEK